MWYIALPAYSRHCPTQPQHGFFQRFTLRSDIQSHIPLATYAKHFSIV
ncbi:MAG: hypothetical protein PUD39_00750 [Bacteroidales bacterium]|nr:hypothetical protein [Bacteroidales bacterium]